RILLDTVSLCAMHVAVIAAAKTGSLAGKLLRKKTVAKLTIVNRDLERAKALEVDACVQAVPLEELREAVSHADVVISATDAPHMILGPEHIVPRKDRPLLLVDLAVPRDIDPFLNELPRVTLLDIDHLRNDIAHSKAAREAEIPQVEKIIEKELALLNQRLPMIGIEPTIAALRQKAESIRKTELSRILDELGPIDGSIAEKLEFFSSALVNKLLHEPTLHLRRGHTDLDVQGIRRLFGLQEPRSHK
ncbi:MAG: glutamyl-tRNA reductase, partial [Bacteroidetes bacterium]|nr:glutamyl-tRNA reductase [Bacteroidota bacterium]